MTDANASRRTQLMTLLGDLPDRDRPLTAETVSLVEHDGYLLETLTLDLNGIEAVPAFYVRPIDAPGPLPVAHYHHAHGGDYLLRTWQLHYGVVVLGFDSQTAIRWQQAPNHPLNAVSRSP